MKIQTFTGFQVGDRFFPTRIATEEYAGETAIRERLEELGVDTDIAALVIDNLRSHRGEWKQFIELACSSAFPQYAPGKNQ